MPAVLSENAKLYRNTGTYASPTWDLVSNVKDLTMSLDKDEVDITTRASGGFKEFIDGMIDASIDFGMVYDTADTDFTAIRTAFFAKTAIEFLILDGLVATAGNQGLRVTCMVKGFTRNENLGEALMVDVTLRPVKNGNAAPAWFTVGA